MCLFCRINMYQRRSLPRKKHPQIQRAGIPLGKPHPGAMERKMTRNLPVEKPHPGTMKRKIQVLVRTAQQNSKKIFLLQAVLRGFTGQ